MEIKDMFSKSNQEVLKNEYRNAIASFWSDEKMVNYCTNCVLFFMEIRGSIIEFEKKQVVNDFWFGYSDFGQGMSYSENEERIANIRKNLHDYFIEKNVDFIDNKIKTLEAYINNADNSYKFYLVQIYSNCPNVKNISFRRFWENDVDEENKLTLDEAKLYLEGLKKYREMIVKKCESYWKRYGSSKIKLNTYWIDR